MDAISIKKAAAKHAAELQAYYGQPVSRLTAEQVAVYMGLIGDESLGDALVTDLAAEKQARSVADDPIRVAVCARAAHEVCRIWCEAHGDYSVRPWETLAQMQRERACNDATAVLCGSEVVAESDAAPHASAQVALFASTVKSVAAAMHLT